MKDYSCLWEEKIMEKGKKHHWGFTCVQCKEKISSKEHTEYYLLRWENLVNFPLPPNGGLDDIHARFCSKDCLLNHLKDNNFDIEATAKAINKHLDRIRKEMMKYKKN